MKKISLILIAAVTFSTNVATADPILAPVDPLAWAVANADWGYAGGAQMESLREVVNGQVAAHQVSCSYTDPSSRSVMTVKCADPTNCIVCSREAGKSGNKLRQEFSNMASNSQGSISQALSLYATARANAMNEQAKWNDAQKEMTVTETTTDAEGQTQTVTKTITTDTGSKKKQQQAEQIIQQLAQSTQNQQQQQGSMISSYAKAATDSLQKPSPALVIHAGSDPLQ